MPLWQEGERIRADCESMHLALKNCALHVGAGVDKGLLGMTESGVLTLERLLRAEARAFLRAVIPEWVLKL